MLALARIVLHPVPSCRGVLFAGSESGDPGISVPRVEACSGPDNLDMVSEGFLAVGREAGRSTKT